MVGHVAVGMNPCIEALGDFSNDLAQHLPVAGLEENVLPMIASQRDVINGTWRV
jgi:hypothetical protein